MKAIRKFLGYQLFSLNIGEALTIVIAVTILDSFWSHHPWWVPFVLGVCIGAAGIVLRETMNRRHETG